MRVTLLLKGDTPHQHRPQTPANKVEVECHPHTEVAELMQRAWEVFGVPLDSQKIYFKNEVVAPDAKLGECGIGAGAGVAVCGRQLRMAQEDVDKFACHHDQRIAELHRVAATARDKKVLLGVGEESHRALESFDGMSIPPAHTAFRAARKKYVREYQDLLGAVDTAVARL